MSEKSQLWKDIDQIVLRASNHMAHMVVNGGKGTEPEGWSPTDEICELVVEAMSTKDVADTIHSQILYLGLTESALGASLYYVMGMVGLMPDRAGNGSG